jgi:hypothetical protein
LVAACSPSGTSSEGNGYDPIGGAAASGAAAARTERRSPSAKSNDGADHGALIIPPSQARERWVVEMLERQDPEFCGDDVIRSRTASLNGGYEYLEVCSWVTSGQILQRRLSDGHLKDVGPGNRPAVIRNGPWRGFLLLSKHKYRSAGGSYDPWVVVRPDGKEMLEIPNSADGNPEAVAVWLSRNGWTTNAHRFEAASKSVKANMDNASDPSTNLWGTIPYGADDRNGMVFLRQPCPTNEQLYYAIEKKGGDLREGCYLLNDRGNPVVNWEGRSLTEIDSARIVVSGSPPPIGLRTR